MKSPSSQDIGHCKTTYSYYRIYQNWQGKLWSWLDYISHGQHTLQLLSYKALLTHRTVGRKFTSLIESGVFGWLKKIGDVAKLVIRFSTAEGLWAHAELEEKCGLILFRYLPQNLDCVSVHSWHLSCLLSSFASIQGHNKEHFSKKEERHSWDLLSLFPFLLCSRNSALMSLFVFLILHRELYVCV